MQTTDLVAMVVELHALMPTYIDNHMGRAVQHYGLTLLNGYDPALAQRIHNEDDLKPFTCSGLMTDKGILHGEISVGHCAWIRLTGLSADVAAALITYQRHISQRLTMQQPVIVELDRVPWAVYKVHIEGHPWAGATSYQRLIDRQRQANLPRKVKLSFFAPTTFRSKDVNIPLPLPSLVFGSLLSRWITFTAHRLRDLPQDQLDAFIAHHLLISRHAIKTELMRGKQGGKEIGFVGEVCYEISRKSSHLAKQDPELETLLQSEYRWFARTIGMLADFAVFSGVGRKTTTGLGMAKEY